MQLTENWSIFQEPSERAHAHITSPLVQANILFITLNFNSNYNLYLSSKVFVKVMNGSPSVLPQMSNLETHTGSLEQIRIVASQQSVQRNIAGDKESGSRRRTI